MERLKKAGHIRCYARDEVIFYENDDGEEMFILLSGKVGIASCSLASTPEWIATLEPGSFFGEMSLLEDLPRSASAIVKEDASVLAVPRSAFQTLLTDEPDLGFRIMKALSSRLRKQNEESQRLRMELNTLKRSLPEKDGAEEQKEEEEPATQKKTEEPEKTEGPKLSANFVISGPPEPAVDLSEDEVLFPPEHQLYNLQAPATHQEYLLDKTVSCPVCFTENTVKNQRFSRLKYRGLGEDFRQLYEGHDPEWYSIWVCQKCYYANFHSRFTQKPFSFQRDAVLKRALGLRSQVNLAFTEPREIDQVFISYYLALKTLQSGKKDVAAMAKVWMTLYWLYGDAGDTAMEEIARRQAFHFIYRCYFEASNINQKEEQKLCSLIGHFYEYYQNPAEARKFYYKAIVRRGGDSRINDLAYDHVARLKKILKKASEEA